MGTLKGPRAEPANAGPARELFRYEARREGRVVVVMTASLVADGAVVETEIYPVTGVAGQDPVHRPFTFTSPEVALRFAEETLVALEYLGCGIV